MGKDLFSSQASQYAAFRPTYPPALYEFIFRHVKHFETAWDAGTGNGQVARDLSGRFSKIFATDISEKQIANAVRLENIFYSVGGETCVLPDGSVDLVTVAQAIHWFDRDIFYREVVRVAKPGSAIAVWGYGLLRVDTTIDAVIDNFYVDIIGPYWDKERRLIDEHYQTIAFPFQEIKPPGFSFSFEWSLDELQGYLTTWSSVQKFIREQGRNPVDDLIETIRPFWNQGKEKVEFPLFLRLGQV